MPETSFPKTRNELRSFSVIMVAIPYVNAISTQNLISFRTCLDCSDPEALKTYTVTQHPLALTSKEPAREMTRGLNEFAGERMGLDPGGVNSPRGRRDQQTCFCKCHSALVVLGWQLTAYSRWECEMLCSETLSRPQRPGHHHWLCLLRKYNSSGKITLKRFMLLFEGYKLQADFLKYVPCVIF